MIADSGFSRRFQEFVRNVCRWAVSITTKAAQAFVVRPRRWVVERTSGWFVRSRRLMVDYGHLPESSEAKIQLAKTLPMLRRLHPSGHF